MRQLNSRHRNVLLFAVLANCGCVAIYRTKPIDVLVLDAETGAPIRDATIHVSHGPNGIDPLWALTLNKPENTKTIADGDGRATVNVARFGWIFWGASAPGYLNCPDAQFTGRGYVPTKFAREGDDTQAVIRLFREPTPTISIVVPDGYRGPLLLDRRPAEQVSSGDIGRRDFVLRANERGYLRIDSPLLLEQIESSLTIPVAYENGQPIPEDDAHLGDDAIGVRWMTSSYNYDIVVVGTQSDANVLHPIIHQVIDGDPRRTRTDLSAVDALFSTAAGQPVSMFK